MTYKDNTPTYNVGNRKVVNFNDFCDDCEKSKLDSIKRATKPNSPDEQQYIGNKRWKFNAATRKWDDLAPDMVDDKLDAIEVKEKLESNTYDSNNLGKEYYPTQKLNDSFNNVTHELDLLEKRLFWAAERYKELEVLANQVNELKSNFKNIIDTYDTFEANVLSK